MADTAFTISSARVSPLSEQEIAATGCNTKYVFNYSDIALGSGASDTVTVTLGPTPASWYIDKCLGNISTAFTGITAMTVIVGTTSSTAALVSSKSILTAGMINQAVGVPILTNTTATASVSLVATFTAAGTGGPAGLTAGSMSLYINLKDSTKLP
jgi:hypothetical protein